MKTKLFLVVGMITVYSVKAQLITTVAGNGTAGYGGNGGQATAAELKDPCGGVIDALGNMYFVDSGNNLVRKISTSGIISTIAGTGTAGYTGDGGQATAATLNEPIDIALDLIGNIYISDDQNNAIRKVNTNGIISTMVGTGTAGYNGDGIQATAAEINSPNGISIDVHGNLYIADGSNQRVRMVNTAGIITTIAGNGYGGWGGDGGQATATELNNPCAIVSMSGNLYIADAQNNRIRMINSSGIITTIAGSGPTGVGSGSYSGDGGQATAATLWAPTELTFDAGGNMYICDVINERIRKVSTSGIITTIVGNGGGGYNGDGILATAASLSYPEGIFFDASGVLYIADQANNRIRKVGIGNSVPVVGFHASATIVCVGSTVTFSDSTVNTVVTGWQWNFPGGTLASGSTLTDAMPQVIYNTPGTYAVSYTATASAGSASITKTSYMHIVTSVAQFNTAFFEGFETSSVPGTDWSISSTTGSNWTVTSTVAASGSKSIMINNLSNTAGDISILMGPTFDLASIGSPALSFAMAYQQQTTTNTDELQVAVSTDCGATWISKWVHSGTALQPVSVGGQSISPFIPVPSQFTTYTVNLNSVASSTNVMFRWVFYAGASSVGNNIYLDNINIYNSTATGIEQFTGNNEQVTIYPNPSNGNFVIETSSVANQTIQLYDINGRLVLSQTIQGKTAIDANRLNEGVYNIIIIGNEGVVNKRLVIVR
jgi:PKD repeat protein